MNAPAVALIVVGNAAFAVGVLGWVVQRTERSEFRYTMWRLRDRIVDALRAGEVPPHPAATQAINRAEIVIAATDRITPFHFIITSRTLRRGGWTPGRDADLTADAPEPLQRLLLDVKAEARHAHRRLLVLGSPSGWLLLSVGLLIMPWFLIAGVRERQRHRKHRDDPRPPLDKVASWSSRRYGSPAEVFAPVVKQKNGGMRRDAAYA